VPEYARFENLNEVPEMDLAAPLKVNSGFDNEPITYTVKSKMNVPENSGQDFDTFSAEETPF
jgi:hypothetical protein